MKKTKVIALVLCAAIMMMGAGYAYWTDSLTIINTVTTGIFDVNFVAPSFSSNTVIVDDYMEGVTNREAKMVTFTISNLYPGASYTTLTQEENNGTIPAKFANAVVTFGPNTPANLPQNIYVSFDCWIYDENGNHIGTTPYQNVTLDQLQNALNTSLANVQLEPSQSIVLKGEGVDQLMNFTMNPQTAEFEDETFSFNIQLNWMQHNAQ